MTTDLFALAPAERQAPPRSAPASDNAACDAAHLCRVCGAWGAFGFDVALLKGKTGRFACLAHREQVERMAA